ncbi:amidohydrolase family protein [Ruminococcaceae bacterium OttesenSCG-928-O06]|nr:amidohydrolase family protein [Ruminococcaceae bacterium OttesenSCG-928-O06]
MNAAGKTITPGFIDMHSHADVTVLLYPQMESMLRQGITTFVGCQCGQSVAPIGRWWLHNQALLDHFMELSPKLFADPYDDDYYVLSSVMRKLMDDRYGVDHAWPTFGAWLDAVDAHGLSGNMVTLIGYSTLRVNAVLNERGEPDDARVPTEAEKARLKAGLREAMEAGAFGMSVGLDYKPGIFSKTPELMEMAAEMAPYDGIYFAHWRKTGLRAGTPKKQKKIDGIIETLEVGLQNSIQVQISHLSTGYDIFPTDDDYMQTAAARRTLQVIDEYVAKGVRANFDVIPNITGGTMIAPWLVGMLLPWIYRAGGLTNFLQYLRYPDYRNDISRVINSGGFFRLNPLVQPDWDENTDIIESVHEDWVGKTVAQLAKQRGKNSLETLYDLMLEDPSAKVFRATHSMNRHAVQEYYNHPLATVGNDTFVFDTVSTVGFDAERPGNRPNPNTYCGFVKFIKEYGMPRLEDSIYKTTGRAAEILHLSDRGLLKEGYRADVLLIDMDELATNESVIDPRVYPTGITHVLVNGTPVIDAGQHTGALPGGVIRRQTR